jgi:hypothetical protein
VAAPRNDDWCGRVISPGADRRTVAGNSTSRSGKPSSQPNAHLVLEQLAQRFEQLEVHVLGRVAEIVTWFDRYSETDGKMANSVTSLNIMLRRVEPPPFAEGGIDTLGPERLISVTLPGAPEEIIGYDERGLPRWWRSDTSAIAAILFDEPDAGALEGKNRRWSGTGFVSRYIPRAHYRHRGTAGRPGGREFDLWLHRAEIEKLPVDPRAGWHGAPCLAPFWQGQTSGLRDDGIRTGKFLTATRSHSIAPDGFGVTS